MVLIKNINLEKRILEFLDGIEVLITKKEYEIIMKNIIISWNYTSYKNIKWK